MMAEIKPLSSVSRARGGLKRALSVSSVPENEDAVLIERPLSPPRCSWDLNLRYELLCAVYSSFKDRKLKVHNSMGRGGGSLANEYSAWARALSNGKRTISLRQVKSRWEEEKRLWRQVEWMLDNTPGTVVDRETGQLLALDSSWEALKRSFREPHMWLRKRPFLLPESNAYDLYVNIFRDSHSTSPEKLDDLDYIQYQEELDNDDDDGDEAQFHNSRSPTEAPDVETIGVIPRQNPKTRGPMPSFAEASTAQTRQAKKHKPHAAAANNNYLDVLKKPFEAGSSRKSTGESSAAAMDSHIVNLGQNLARTAEMLSRPEGFSVVTEAIQDANRRFKSRLSVRQRLEIARQLRDPSEANLYLALDGGLKDQYMKELVFLRF
jgi:hypothetical protein